MRFNPGQVYVKERGFHANDPGDTKQEHDAEQHGQYIRPMLRAFGCSSGGSLDEMMDRKMMLSTPSTISRNVSVSKLTHTAPEVKSGIAKRNI
jgi:hypothetical protein